MKILLLCVAFIFCNQVCGQTDSTLHVSLLSHYSLERASASGTPYPVFTAEAIFKKMDFTIVPTFRRKTLFGKKAKQVGVSVYKNFYKSYLNIAVSYSPDDLFPSLNLTSDFYLNAMKGLELRLAYNYRTYVDGTKSQMGIMGFGYDYRRMRFNYNAYQPLDKSLAHQVSIRRSMGECI